MMMRNGIEMKVFDDEVTVGHAWAAMVNEAVQQGQWLRSWFLDGGRGLLQDLPGTASVLKHFKPGQHHQKASRCGQSTKRNESLAAFERLEIEQRSSLPGPDMALLDASSSTQIQTGA